MKIGDEITYQDSRAIVSEQRGEFLFDLIVYAPNADGQSPHIVRCVDFTPQDETPEEKTE